MIPCIDFLPSERIRVFISSAQSDENGFAWADVRKRIKDSLASCVYLNPFILEDEGSVTSSLQFFQRQVEKADLVVLLVKGELRNGTSTEYTLATKLNKPLLAYFIDDENPSQDVIQLKKKIESADQCTYHKVDSFEDIELIIRNDVMNNVVRTFQDNTGSTSIIENDNTASTEIPIDEIKNSSGIPTKISIDKFNSCYNWLFDLLNLQYFKNEITPAQYHDLGCAHLSWLVNGELLIEESSLKKFIKENARIYINQDLLQMRWTAIQLYFRGDLIKALETEDQALASARESKESSWVINNILIDCRNIENAISNYDHSYRINSHYQEDLSSQDNVVYLPVLDRYCNNIYEYIETDEFKEYTASPNTKIFGSNLSNAINYLANYVFSATIIGSITNLSVARKILAHILNRYSRIHNEPSLAFLALKQYILLGDAKDFKLYLDSTWDLQYTFITTQTDDIWRITDSVPLAYRNHVKLMVFSSLGLYLSDEVFDEASTFVFNLSASIIWFDSASFFDAIITNISRLNSTQIIRAITPIITEKRFHLGNKISQLVFHIDLSAVDEKSLKVFADALEQQLPYIISNNGDPQMISVLVEHSREIFGKLETIEGNGLTGIQGDLYKINQGSDDWCPILKKEIDSARIQFEMNSKKGIYHEFASNPYFMISSIVRKDLENVEIDKLIIDELIPLSVEVLNSEAAIPTKASCLSCLCEILSAYKKQNKPLPSSVIEALKTVNIENSMDFFTSSTRKTIEIRVLMAQLLAGIINEKELLRWCIEFEQLSISEKTAVIDCLEKYLYHKRDDLAEINLLVVSIVLQCHSTSHHQIRGISIRCLAYLVESEYKDIATSELNASAFDPSDYVRKVLLNTCRNKVLNKDVSKEVLSLLCNDANYYIRREANSLITEINH